MVKTIIKNREHLQQKLIRTITINETKWPSTYSILMRFFDIITGYTKFYLN